MGWLIAIAVYVGFYVFMGWWTTRKPKIKQVDDLHEIPQEEAPRDSSGTAT